MRPSVSFRQVTATLSNSLRRHSRSIAAAAQSLIVLPVPSPWQALGRRGSRHGRPCRVRLSPGAGESTPRAPNGPAVRCSRPWSQLWPALEEMTQKRNPPTYARAHSCCRKPDATIRKRSLTVPSYRTSPFAEQRQIRRSSSQSAAAPVAAAILRVPSSSSRFFLAFSTLSALTGPNPRMISGSLASSTATS